MSANSIKVQLGLVILLSQPQELFRASEPKKSLCSWSFGNYAYLSKLPCEIRKGLQLLSLAFKNYTFLLIPPSGPRRTLNLAHVYARCGPTGASIEKHTLKAAFGQGGWVRLWNVMKDAASKCRVRGKSSLFKIVFNWYPALLPEKWHF